MNKQFVTYKIALKLKELGFDEKCLGYFNNSEKLTFGIDVPDKSILLTNKGKAVNACLAPLWQQVIDWLVDVHKYHIEPAYGDYAKKWAFQLNAVNGGRKPPFRSDYIYNYSEVKIHAILKALELINK